MPVTEENKALVARLYEAFNSGDSQVLEEIVHPRFVDHGFAADDPVGPERLEDVIRIYREAFTDISVSVDDLVATEDDRILVAETFAGTHDGRLVLTSPQGEQLRIPPTGRRVEMSGLNVFRLADNMIIERWGEEDTLGLLQQLRVVTIEQEKPEYA